MFPIAGPMGNIAVAVNWDGAGSGDQKMLGLSGYLQVFAKYTKYTKYAFPDQ